MIDKKTIDAAVSELHRIAGECIRNQGMPPCEEHEYRSRITKEVLDYAALAEQQTNEWAHRIHEVANRLEAKP